MTHNPFSLKNIFITFLALMSMTACNKESIQPGDYDNYPTALPERLWPEYKPEQTIFKIWSPLAEQVRMQLYPDGDQSSSTNTHELALDENGVWKVAVEGDLNGMYYTFQVRYKGEWLQETPGIYAQAVGVNGKRAMVVDLRNTNPEGWDKDQGPSLSSPNQAIIYEMHVRDVTIHPNAGSSHPGKYLGLIEKNTRGPAGVSTGIDHMKDLGITHVHLLPAYDHYSIDESKLDSAQFNWGYDPQNYNVPEGSYSSDPYQAATRIREFKQMVQGFHAEGIGVILDVVYNHTGRTENSNFNLEVPGYYYRHNPDGSLSDASACGNETASERAMVRKFIKESVAYWATEYHLDGFRFDLMGIHDQETMNQITDTLKSINPNIIIYGEGWTAGDSPLPVTQRALKKYTFKMPKLSAFSDDIRDGLKGSVFEDESTGFVSGAQGMEASVKFGVVGSIKHPQIDYKAVNYSDTAWALQPWQAISYVSCHDNHTLFDKLKISRPEAGMEKWIAMDKLANAVVLTSQGTPFLHAGAEMLRTKNGEHNSYNLPDSINRIDWSRKSEFIEVFDYYKNLIALRKSHPALKLSTAEQVRQLVKFIPHDPGVVAFTINGADAGDPWRRVMVVYNAKESAISLPLEGSWTVALRGDDFESGANEVNATINVPAISTLILFQAD